MNRFLLLQTLCNVKRSDAVECHRTLSHGSTVVERVDMSKPGHT
ncbi:hypothetical protein HSB1_15010 [Halogranum salarium B-1]|uniref:Uncharacterized protein n=1 Tax=Halogranum salarium B-1 TaxID=1210908 RepID=J3A5Y9_9EURY|nr:hypothetical protein HSB1_15010 [Halogranum salarium B-1]